MTIDNLRTAALELEPMDRARLARALLESLNDLSEAEIEQLWASEAAQRNGELDRGEARSAPIDEVIGHARHRCK